MRGWLEAWTRDLILAARSLRRAPGFAVVTVATLTIAIGANTAIFSVIDSVLLDPLDFPAADRLVSIRASAPGSDLPEEFGPGPEFYIQYRDIRIPNNVPYGFTCPTEIRRKYGVSMFRVYDITDNLDEPMIRLNRSTAFSAFAC